MGDAVRVCARDDLAPGSARCFDVNGERVAVVRIDDDFYAIGDTCSHADFSLSEGDVWADEREIECPKHGSTFSLITGEPQTLPAIQPVLVYDVIVEGDDVKVAHAMSVLTISGLRVQVAGKEILHGVDLEVASGEVHALMGPNGSGKSTLSHTLMGRADYEIIGGSITIDGDDLTNLPTWQRAQRGLFLAMQYPVEVPGVPLEVLVSASMRARDLEPAGLHESVLAEAETLGVRDELLARGVNDEFSGGEQKRAETVQLAVLKPGFAILDEIDSGLDVDSLRDVARRVERMTKESNLGVLAITHYARVLTELRPDRVHVMLDGRIARSGGPELADELEANGYEGITTTD